MPVIRNSTLIKKFVDFFQLKVGDSLDSEAGNMLVPVITHPVLPLIVTFTPSELEFASGITVPAGKKWKLKLVHVRWVSDVNVGNRVIELRVSDGATGFVAYQVASRNFQAASLTVEYNFAIGVDSVGSASGLQQTIPLPTDVVFLEGTSIFITDVASIAAGDVGSGFVLVEEEDLLEGEIESDRAL